MAKTLHNDVLDALLAEIAKGTIITICSAQPTTRTEAVTTYALADVTVTAGDGNGDFTIGDGDTSGRKVAVTEQADITVDSSGTATYIAICDATRLLAVTTCTSQVLTAANLVTIPTFKVEVADPT
jgi:hypothetical protein